MTRFFSVVNLFANKRKNTRSRSKHKVYDNKHANQQENNLPHSVYV